MSVAAGTRERTRGRVAECGWFLAWAALGAAIALGTLIFVVLALIPSLLLIALAWSVRASRRSVFGIAAGFGLPLLYVAYVHRMGPGTACWETATRAGCEEHLDPLPWLAVGVVLLLVGAVGQAWRARTTA